MSKNEILRRILFIKLSQRQERNKSYSKRKFASDLGVSPGALIDFLNSKREFSERSILRICKIIGVNEDELLHINNFPVFKHGAPGQAGEDFFLDESGLVEFKIAFGKYIRRCKKIESRIKGKATHKIGLRVLVSLAN